LPWHRRAEAQEQKLTEARRTLYRVHQDWAPLADPLARIDNEIRLNEWTLTAKRVFAGGDE
jgi:hypothetical protein